MSNRSDCVSRETVVTIVQEIMGDAKKKHKGRAIIKEIQKLPETNVQEIVYCKSCKYYGDPIEPLVLSGSGHTKGYNLHKCKLYQLPQCAPRDFCSRGTLRH